MTESSKLKDLVTPQQSKKSVKSKSKKSLYPPEFIVCRPEIHTTLKPNSRDTFILSKYKKEGQNLFSRTHTYVSLTPINTYDGFVLRAYIIPKEFRATFDSSTYTEFGIFAFQNKDDEDDIIPVYAASWEFVKCPQCGGSGMFKKSIKTKFAEKEGIAAKSKIAQAQVGSEIVATHCVYNPHHQAGCNGTGIDKAQIAIYTEKVAELYNFDAASMQSFIEFAKYSGKGVPVDATEPAA